MAGIPRDTKGIHKAGGKDRGGGTYKALFKYTKGKRSRSACAGSAFFGDRAGEEKRKEKKAKTASIVSMAAVQGTLKVLEPQKERKMINVAGLEKEQDDDSEEE